MPIQGGSLYGSNWKLARGLGWLSLALGAALALTPGRVARLSGVPTRRRLLRFLGMRELTSGIGILGLPRPEVPLWSRVGGDAMDLGLLSRALLSGRSNRWRVFKSLLTVAAIAGLDYYASRNIRSRQKPGLP